MKTIAEVKTAQAYLVNEVNKTFEEILRNLQKMENEDDVGSEKRTYETVYPLTTDPAIFKGKKPTCVLLGEKRVIAHTWKNVFKILILECNADTKRHKELMELRNKVLGRERVILSDNSRGMLRPFQIDEELWAETHYDTESLMRILLHRILDEVGFDYSDISVAVRNER
jgi:hypothetical protein